MMTIKMVNAVIVLILNFTQSGRESVTGSFNVIRFINLGIRYKWVGVKVEGQRKTLGLLFGRETIQPKLLLSVVH